MTHANPTLTAFGADHERSSIASLVDAGVVRRAGIVALILGSVLTLANQSDAVFGDGTIDTLQLVLFFLTPFIVVTISQVLGIRRALSDAGQGRPPASPQNTFFTTAVSHGIPMRSLLVGLVTGTVNLAIVSAATLIDGGALSDIPSGPVAQAYILPTLFGLVSQTMSYRRATRAIGVRSPITAQPAAI
jgi:hypothetical protein